MCNASKQLPYIFFAELDEDHSRSKLAYSEWSAVHHFAENVSVVRPRDKRSAQAPTEGCARNDYSERKGGSLLKFA